MNGESKHLEDQLEAVCFGEKKGKVTIKEKKPKKKSIYPRKML